MRASRPPTSSGARRALTLTRNLEPGTRNLPPRVPRPVHVPIKLRFIVHFRGHPLLGRNLPLHLQLLETLIGRLVSYIEALTVQGIGIQVIDFPDAFLGRKICRQTFFLAYACCKVLKLWLLYLEKNKIAREFPLCHPKLTSMSGRTSNEEFQTKITNQCTGQK